MQNPSTLTLPSCLLISQATSLKRLEHQETLQTLYTGGTVFHIFLGERLNSWKAAAELIKKVAWNSKLPYFTLTPTFSVCPTHGYTSGEHKQCPTCGANCEVYSRVVGTCGQLTNGTMENKQNSQYAKPSTDQP